MRVFYRFISFIFPNLFFYIKDSESIYLTFDDGPSENTHWILQELEKYEAKATFFLLGESLENNYEKLEKIVEGGHAVGYHSFSHDNLWRISKQKAIADYEKCVEFFISKLYRPPYGKITLGMYRYLSHKCKIILWDVSFRDWEKHDDIELLIEKKLKQIKPGSIILLHDNEKSIENLKIILPRILEFGKEKGVGFDSI